MIGNKIKWGFFSSSDIPSEGHSVAFDALQYWESCVDATFMLNGISTWGEAQSSVAREKRDEPIAIQRGRWPWPTKYGRRRAEPTCVEIMCLELEQQDSLSKRVLPAQSRCPS